MKKAELLQRITKSRASVSAKLAALTEPEMDLVVDVESGWSIKALLAHLAFWEHATLDCRLRGALPELLKDVRQINAGLLLKARNQSCAEVLREFNSSGAQILDEIRSLTEEDLCAPAPWNDGKSLWEHLADDTFIHYSEHEHSFQRWISQITSQR